MVRQSFSLHWRRPDVQKFPLTNQQMRSFYATLPCRDNNAQLLGLCLKQAARSIAFPPICRYAPSASTAPAPSRWGN